MFHIAFLVWGEGERERAAIHESMPYRNQDLIENKYFILVLINLWL